MDYLPAIFAAEDGYCDITNAFAFDREHVFILLNCESEDEGLTASALLRVNLDRKKLSYDVLHEFDSGSLDYWAEGPGLHYILASGGYIHRIRDGQMTFHDFASQAFLFKLARLDESSVAVFGEDGEVYRFRDGAYTRLPTPTDETLYGMHFPAPDTGFAGGNFGTFLSGDSRGFAAIDLGGSEGIRAVRVKPDGTVLLGCSDGTGLVVFNDEIQRIEGNPADFYAITEYGGEELWGDDDYGVWTRKGGAFVPRFATGGGFNLNVSNGLLTINAGYSVYVHDGKDWTLIRINPEMDNLLELAPLDFTPD